MTKMVTRSKSSRKRKYFEEEQENNTELLPGLPNDVTLQLISTKLPWRTFYVLASVSRAWLGAIRSGKINDARVRSRTTETLVVIPIRRPTQCFGIGNAMALYSLRDKAFYPLPPLPGFEYGLSGCCRNITTAGKIYILGGILKAKVYMLDVARQKKWQQCASMHTPRSEFGCAEFEGKIYIFGGWNDNDFRNNYCRLPIDYSEVYDPKVDAWIKISPMKSTRCYHDAGVVRDEILVHGGYVHDLSDFGYSQYWRPIEISRDGMEAYNPAKDSWRTIPPGEFGRHEFHTNREKLFTANGRLHSLTQRNIVIFDFDKKSVKDLHTCSIEKKRKEKKTCSFGTRSNVRPRRRFCPRGVLATDDGLLTIGHFQHGPRFDDDRLYQSATRFDEDKLYQSGTRQLGMGKKRIVLEEVECSHLVRFRPFASFVWPIQL